MSALRQSALSVALLSLGLALGANAQTSGTTAAPSASSGSAATSGSAASKSGPSSSIDRGDRKFMETAAQDGMAEVQLGQLAAQKAQSDQVKQFGQRMVDDHTKANDQLKQIASAKGVQLPTDTDRGHKRDMDKMSKLSGAEFDREYMKHMVSEHKKDVKAFQKEAKDAKDPELKSFASSTAPILQQHLQLAQTTESAVRNEGKGSASRAAGTTSATSATGNSGATSRSTKSGS